MSGPNQPSEVSYGPDLREDEDVKESASYTIRPAEWKQCEREWTESRTGLGIITIITENNDSRPVFQSWRGLSAARNYIALTKQRRDAASYLYRLVDSFINRQSAPERSISCLLVDKPGSGKSALIEGIATSLNADWRKIDLSQMAQRADLITRLDALATDQANSPRPLLVFVDEIDDDGGNWYGQFLLPLEASMYVREGNAVYLRPCVWVFAGSGKQPAQGSKFDDFKSRLTDGELTLAAVGGREADEQLERLERVYVAVTLLHQRFPHVTHISLGVLRTFWRISPGVEMRRVRHLVHKITAVRGSHIRESDVAFIPRALRPDEYLRSSPIFRSTQKHGWRSDMLVEIQDGD